VIIRIVVYLHSHFIQVSCTIFKQIYTYRIKICFDNIFLFLGQASIVNIIQQNV